MKRVVHKAKKYLVPHKSNDFRPYMLRAVGITAIFFFILSALFATRLQAFILRSTNMIATVLPAVLVDLTNNERTGRELGALKTNPKLVAAAEAKANDMVAKNYFAHDSPEGLSPWSWIMESGYEFAYAGENLAVNFDDSSVVNTAWMNSPKHRANILNAKFTEVGIATAEGYYKGEPTTFVVQMFGTPAAPKTVSAPVTQAVSVTPKPGAKTDVEEVKLEPMASSEVLGQSATETFVAVRNMSASPIEAAPSTAAVDNTDVRRSSSLIEQYSSSPSKVLGAIYLALALLLTIAFFAVLVTRHDHKNKHIAFVLILFVVLFCAYYVYQFSLLSKIEIL